MGIFKDFSTSGLQDIGYWCRAGCYQLLTVSFSRLDAETQPLPQRNYLVPETLRTVLGETGVA